MQYLTNQCAYFLRSVFPKRDNHNSFCFFRVALIAVLTMLIGFVAIKSVVYGKSLPPSLLFCRTQ